MGFRDMEDSACEDNPQQIKVRKKETESRGLHLLVLGKGWLKPQSSLKGLKPWEGWTGPEGESRLKSLFETSCQIFV